MVHNDLAAPPAIAKSFFGDRMDVAIGYARLLATTGVDHGLIGPREVSRLWGRHILNCAMLAHVLDDGVTVGDIGSGAGLPGLAVAIARPDVQMHLIEPLARRTVWLEAAVAELALENVDVHRGRAESLADVMRFDVVTARAVARLALLAGWSAPLLKAGGELIAFKGATAREEIAQDRAVIARVGGEEPRMEVLGADVLEVPTTLVRVTFPVEGGAMTGRATGAKARPGQRNRPGRAGSRRRS